ncbi:transposable element Tcb2 transposase [Trichonephila clavipes]|nr:transposable element Tcb2 transposase [Trichonephila clavipes]
MSLDFEAMDPAQEPGGPIMVWGLFFRGTIWDLWCIYQLLNAIRNVELQGDHLHPFMLFCFPLCKGIFHQGNCTSHKSWLAISWLYNHSSGFSVINWPPRSLDLYPIQHLWDVLEQGVKDHHTAPTNFIEL